MRVTFRFVGSESLLGPIWLKVFGQKVEDIEEDAIVDALCANCLPEADYNQCGFTPLEESTYPTPGAQEGAPASFIEKRKQAWVKLSNYRAAIDGGGEHWVTDWVIAGTPLMAESFKGITDPSTKEA